MVFEIIVSSLYRAESKRGTPNLLSFANCALRKKNEKTINDTHMRLTQDETQDEKTKKEKNRVDSDKAV